MESFQRVILNTKDGSHTISIPEHDITFHPKIGAIQESQHIFIETGLSETWNIFHDDARVAEVGFGTGLNAFLTAIEALQQKRPIHYTTLELYPLDNGIIKELNYPERLGYADLFHAIHDAAWNEIIPISEYFVLHKIHDSVLTRSLIQEYHLIYFDAFAPEVQPELWTENMFKKLYDCLVPGGILVTYCSKTIVRRSMQAAGFKVTKVEGPWGKREIVRAFK